MQNNYSMYGNKFGNQYGHQQMREAQPFYPPYEQSNQYGTMMNQCQGYQQQPMQPNSQQSTFYQPPYQSQQWPQYMQNQFEYEISDEQQRNREQELKLHQVAPKFNDVDHIQLPLSQGSKPRNDLHEEQKQEQQYQPQWNNRAEPFFKSPRSDSFKQFVPNQVD